MESVKDIFQLTATSSHKDVSTLDCRSMPWRTQGNKHWTSLSNLAVCVRTLGPHMGLSINQTTMERKLRLRTKLREYSDYIFGLLQNWIIRS